ncbi:MAG TPA: XRE family transcriptional regulator [Rhizobiales bacterium]|nr:XRE family transcriptional regulator [Hyphomicrobiales bacterium]
MKQSPEKHDSVESDHPQHQDLGRRLRLSRKSKGMSLAQVAEAAGLAISTISRAERGLLALTYDKLIKIAEGLDVELSVLFGKSGESFKSNSLSVARLGDVQVQETATYRYEMLFADIWHKGMTPMTGVVKAHSRAEFDQFIEYPGEEFLFVLSGQLTVHTEAHEPVLLNSGESIYLDSGMGHIYTSAGEEDCRILVVCLTR